MFSTNQRYFPRRLVFHLFHLYIKFFLNCCVFRLTNTNDSNYKIFCWQVWKIRYIFLSSVARSPHITSSDGSLGLIAIPLLEVDVDSLLQLSVLCISFTQKGAIYISTSVPNDTFWELFIGRNISVDYGRISDYINFTGFGTRTWAFGLSRLSNSSSVPFQFHFS